MAKRITLRNNTSNNAGKGSKMSHAEMDANLETFFMSSSLDGNILRLYSTGSVNTDSIDLSGIVGSGNGAQGIQGVQGVTGTGLQGIQGPAGEGGGSSAQGTQGIQGGQGEQGIQGPAGEGSGASVQGTQGIQGTEGTGLQGVQGLTGEAAAQGIQGIQGEQGIQGLAGEGSQGIQGPAGSGGGISSVTVNHLDLVDPFVVATSTLNFTGSGVIVTENPSGTAEIFIPSSAGAQGTTGAQGITGTGIQGVQGTSGTGAQGTTGTGAQGTQGILGIQGVQGAVQTGAFDSNHDVVETLDSNVLLRIDSNYGSSPLYERIINDASGAGLPDLDEINGRRIYVAQDNSTVGTLRFGFGSWTGTAGRKTFTTDIYNVGIYGEFKIGAYLPILTGGTWDVTLMGHDSGGGNIYWTQDNAFNSGTFYAPDGVRRGAMAKIVYDYATFQCLIYCSSWVGTSGGDGVAAYSTW